MQLLVTGGAGFIGSNFVELALGGLFEREIQAIKIVDSLTYAGSMVNLDRSLVDPRVKFYNLDINDTDTLPNLIDENTVVVNFAAESHVDRSISSSRNFVLTNVLGVENLLSICLARHAQRFVQISTDEVYGSIPIGSANESSPLVTNSPYSASKASADLLALSYFKTHQLPVTVTRCTNNFGKYQHEEKFIPVVIKSLLARKAIPVYGTGKNIREWIHVDDHCAGIARVIESGKVGEIYNFGSGIEKTNLDIVNEISEILEIKENFTEFVKDRSGHDFRYSVNCSKAKKELNWEPRSDFQTALRETLEWYKSGHPAWGTTWS
jgi:dTDP-glucose 4,6-dehydratase